MFAERVFVGPEALGHGFADNHSGVSARYVGVCQVASAQKRDAHGAQVASTYYAHIHFRLVGHGNDRLAFDGDGLVRATVGHGKVIDHASRLDTRCRPNLLEDALEKGDIRGWGCELIGWNRNRHGEQAIWIEAGFDVAKLQQSANHKAGTDQQNQGESNFGDNQETACLAATEIGAAAALALLESLVDIRFGKT